MRHDLISKDPVFQSIIPQIIEKTKVALTKVSTENGKTKGLVSKIKHFEIKAGRNIILILLFALCPIKREENKR